MRYLNTSLYWDQMGKCSTQMKQSSNTQGLPMNSLARENSICASFIPKIKREFKTEFGRGLNAVFLSNWSIERSGRTARIDGSSIAISRCAIKKIKSFDGM